MAVRLIFMLMVASVALATVADLGNADRAGPRLGESADPPAPGPAPSDLTQALLEAQASSDEKKEEAKMLLKPPGCRPTSSEELRDYGTLKTQCAAQPTRKTQISVGVPRVHVIDVDDLKDRLTASLTVSYSWTDPALSEHSLDSLWQAQTEFDFLDVVSKRLVGKPSVEVTGTSVSVIETYEVTVTNSWDIQKFPFDNPTLAITLVAPSLTEAIEPITVSASSASSTNSDKEFHVEQFLVATGAYGAAQGSTGAWGSAQMVSVTADADRYVTKPLLGSVVPVLLIPFLSYAGFFISGEQIQARVTLGVVSLLGVLVVYGPANFYDGSGTVGFSLDTCLSWFALFQCLVVCVCIGAQLVSYSLTSQTMPEKSESVDTTFKILFPVFVGMAGFAAYAASFWEVTVSLPVCAALLVVAMVCVLVVLYGLDKKAEAHIAKSKDFPGI
jgi:hypothetical protein